MWSEVSLPNFSDCSDQLHQWISSSRVLTGASYDRPNQHFQGCQVIVFYCVAVCKALICNQHIHCLCHNHFIRPLSFISFMYYHQLYCQCIMRNTMYVRCSSIEVQEIDPHLYPQGSLPLLLPVTCLPLPGPSPARHRQCIFGKARRLVVFSIFCYSQE